MKTVYYAHCMAIYDTHQEWRDVNALEAMGFVVSNPNNDEVSSQCTRIRAEVASFNATCISTGRDASREVMDRVFHPLVAGADVFAFRALPDGRIPSGVALELEWAIAANMPIIELPSRVLGRIIGVDETREYLREVGNR